MLYTCSLCARAHRSAHACANRRLPVMWAATRAAGAAEPKLRPCMAPPSAARSAVGERPALAQDAKVTPANRVGAARSVEVLALCVCRVACTPHYQQIYGRHSGLGRLCSVLLGTPRGCAIYGQALQQQWELLRANLMRQQGRGRRPDLGLDACERPLASLQRPFPQRARYTDVGRGGERAQAAQSAA